MKNYIVLIVLGTLTIVMLNQNSAQSAEIISSSAIEEMLVSKGAEVKKRGFGQQSFNDPNAASLGAIQFRYNSTVLTDDGRKQVEELAVAIKNISNIRFTIVGHTDATGGEEYNPVLSERRAKAVVKILADEFGIASDRLASKGEGESSLIDGDDPASGKNRRVEVINSGPASIN